MDRRLSDLWNRSGHNIEETDPSNPAENRSIFSEFPYLARGIKQSYNDGKPFKNYKWYSECGSCSIYIGRI
jgi:hypothetical protein